MLFNRRGKIKIEQFTTVKGKGYLMIETPEILMTIAEEDDETEIQLWRNDGTDVWTQKNKIYKQYKKLSRKGSINKQKGQVSLISTISFNEKYKS